MVAIRLAIDEAELIAPECDDHDALQALSEVLGDDETTPLRLITANGVEIELPASARSVLLRAVTGLAQRKIVSITPAEPTLTVSEVRALLGATDSYVAEVLKSGELPSTVVGGIREIDLRDAMRLKKHLREQHEIGMLELVRLSEEMGLYDLERTE